MMTVIWDQSVNPDARRWRGIGWQTMTEAGSAKPGRGGRRKRKAERAKIRARIGQRVERKGWPLSWALRKWAIIKGPARPWTDDEIAALVQGPWFVLPAGYELQILEPRSLGRRERRRRAKLRRRRAWTEIRRAARAMLLAMPIIYRPASTEAMRREVNRVALRQRAAMKRHAPWILGASPTPGA
jgi:hypothetical protein